MNIDGVVEHQFPTDTVAESFDLLLSGEIDVVISDNITGTQLIGTEKYKSIKQLSPPVDEALLYSNLHKKHAFLVSKLAAAISTAKKDGTYKRIVQEDPVRD